MDIIHEDQRLMKGTKEVTETCNLSEGEWMALKRLRRDSSIIIKPADKGSTVVIMDKEQYIKEAERQLVDREFYSEIKEPIYLESIQVIAEGLKRLQDRGILSKRQIQYLEGSGTPRGRKFYLLPKVHKNKDSWPFPDVPPRRPIFYDCGSESYGVAKLITFYLNPLSIRHSSYIKDTYHFLERVVDMQISPQARFFSMDVESLYTNIKTKKGLEAVQRCFEKYPEEGRPDGILLRLLELSLMKNDFEFNGRFFLQVKGTAMGKRFAPAYANIYMADWEESVLPRCRITPTQYLSYLDDIWGIWEGTEEEWAEFIQTLNTHHPSIKVKWELNKINFLDVTIYKGSDFLETGRLDSKMFFKSTDIHRDSHVPDPQVSENLYKGGRQSGGR